MTQVTIKRIYVTASSSDGYRVLVDRLWPRGVSKEKAVLDEWAKDIAPSTELRKWFAHDPDKFKEFAKRYVKELEQNSEVSDLVGGWCKHKRVTLLYGAKDESHNEARVLEGWLVKRGFTQSQYDEAAN